MEEHHKQIKNMLELKAILTSSVIENKIPIPIFQLYSHLHQIVSENGIIIDEKENTAEKIKLIVKSTLKIQNILMQQSMKK